MSDTDRYYPEVLKHNKTTNEHFCLDIETTSLIPSKDEGIVEVYWKYMLGGQKIDDGQALFYHPNHVNTSHIH